MGTRVRIMVGLCLVVGLVTLVDVLPLAAAGATGQPAVHKVIVVLRNQVSSLPASRRSAQARRAVVGRTQAPLTAQLARSGARAVHSTATR